MIRIRPWIISLFFPGIGQVYGGRILAEESRLMGYLSKRHVSTKVVVGLSLSILLIIAFVMIRMLLESYRFRVKYTELEIDMSKQDVMQIWDHPEFVISLEDGKEIWSYRNNGHPIHLVLMPTFIDREGQRKTKNVSLEELDDLGMPATQMQKCYLILTTNSKPTP